MSIHKLLSISSYLMVLSSLYRTAHAEPRFFNLSGCQEVTFFYYKSGAIDPIALTYENAPSLLDTSKNSTLIIHGWTENALKPWIKRMASLLNQHSPMNVIAVDYRKVASRIYLFAAFGSPAVADRIAEFIRTNKINPGNLHLIGFSMGGQIAGMVGSKIGAGKIARITGLDIAGPFYERFFFAFLLSDDWRLTKDDAAFVDVIHTDFPFRGAVLPWGHIDFYVNLGFIQPECLLTFHPFQCSHHTAHMFFSNSILNATKYPATPIWFTPPQKNLVYMGYEVTKVEGRFLVNASLEELEPIEN